MQSPDSSWIPEYQLPVTDSRSGRLVEMISSQAFEDYLPKDCIALVRLYDHDCYPHSVVLYASGTVTQARRDADRRFSKLYDKELDRGLRYRFFAKEN